VHPQRSAASWTLRTVDDAPALVVPVPHHASRLREAWCQVPRSAVPRQGALGGCTSAAPRPALLPPPAAQEEGSAAEARDTPNALNGMRFAVGDEVSGGFGGGVRETGREEHWRSALPDCLDGRGVCPVDVDSVTSPAQR